MDITVNLPENIDMSWLIEMVCLSHNEGFDIVKGGRAKDVYNLLLAGF